MEGGSLERIHNRESKLGHNTKLGKEEWILFCLFVLNYEKYFFVIL